MREIQCPECGGDGYTERIRGDQAFDRQPCEKCGGDSALVDDVSPAMSALAEEIVVRFEMMDDLYDEGFDEGMYTRDLLNDMGSALYEIQSILKARCK
jgi:DnaJ-class molecular chaperone